jgi:MoxR-like ATPase
MNQNLNALRTELNQIFPERTAVIDGCLASVIAGEHVLLLGPPGTAKSALARSLAQAFGGRYFERLLTRFSTPEELFGPISLKALEQDQYMRIIAGQLPEAEFAFLDEIFKANSSILNSLLTLMNERTYSNGSAPVACPLVTAFGASNELPDGPELEAVLDRFLLRFDVGYVIRDSAIRTVLKAGEPAVSTKLDLKALQQAQWSASQIKVGDDTIDALLAIRDACRTEGLFMSDRRWKKTLKIVRAVAYMGGEKTASPEDLYVLTDAVWREPKDRAKVARVVGRIADPVSAQATEICDAARETAQKIAALKAGDRKSFVSEAAQGLDAFTAQQKKLAALAKTGGRRAKAVINDVTSEIAAMHGEIAQAVSAGLGLGGAR